MHRKKKRQHHPSRDNNDIRVDGVELKVKEPKNHVYLVEKLKDRGKKKGKNEYLVRWTGSSNPKETWEPEENLPADLRAAFEKSSQKKEQEESE